VDEICAPVGAAVAAKTGGDQDDVLVEKAVAVLSNVVRAEVSVLGYPRQHNRKFVKHVNLYTL